MALRNPLRFGVRLPKTHPKDFFTLLWLILILCDGFGRMQKDFSFGPAKVEIWPVKVADFRTLTDRNSKTAYRNKKIFTPSEAQRKITPYKVPLVKICSDDFF